MPVASGESPAQVTVVVFSKDRPLQLGATLSSLARHCVDPQTLQVHVLYTTSSAYQEGLYQELRLEHPGVVFRTEQRFKRDVEALVAGAEFVCFVVDDAIFVRDFSMRAAIDGLKEDDLAIGFSLRLGANTTYCYTMDAQQELPAFEARPSGILAYAWHGASYDFGYPLELSSSIYRAADIRPLVRRFRFGNPNTLEAELAAKAASFEERLPRLLCFERSVAFCIPANIVQDVAPNRASARPDHSSEALAGVFERGARVDVAHYDKMANNACHQEVELRVSEPVPPRPTVSVIIPSYQQEEFLGDAVASVVAQTWTDWEIVIVDDGSTDATVETALRLIEKHPDRRLRLLRQQNQGVSSARNNAIAASTGRYILPLDADDMLAPQMLEKTVALLESDRSVSIAYTDYEWFGVESRRVTAGVWTTNAMCVMNQLGYCCLYRRGTWAGAGGYNSGQTHYEDWDFWLACIEKGYTARRVPESLFLYRLRPGTRTDEALLRHTELLRELAANHPPLFTLRRRIGRYAFWKWRGLGRRIGSAYARVTRRQRRQPLGG
jgi:glycosyltransferase involved in cell wall biosynthesis